MADASDPGTALARLEPTERSLWVLVGIGVAGVASAALVSMDAAAPLALAALPIALLVDAWRAGAPADVRVTREVPERGHPGEPMQVRYVLEAARPVTLSLVDTLPRGATPTEVVRELTLDAGERASFVVEVRHTSRGRHPFGRVALRTLGPLGLIRRRERRVIEDELVVVPNLSRIGERASRLLRGQDAEGARRRRMRQEGREFESLREYVRGDDLRLVAWKASARAGELIVRRMQPETRQDLVVVLDCGRHMVGRHDPLDGGEPRIDVALGASLTLAAAGILRGDRVGFICLAGDVLRWLPPQPGKSQLARIGDLAWDVTALGEEADYGAAVDLITARQKRRAMVAVVTDVVDEPSARALAAAVARWRGRHLPVVVGVSDPGAARLLRVGGDDEHERRIAHAAQRIVEHRRRGLAAVAAAGARVIDAPAPKAAALAVSAYAAIKTSGRL